jgi:hypothetical protein
MSDIPQRTLTQTCQKQEEECGDNILHGYSLLVVVIWQTAAD